MEITSYDFYIFIALSLLIYWKLPVKHQWKLLLVDSIVFFLLNSKFYTLIYVLASVLTIYYATKYFQKDNISEKSKKIVMVVTLLVNIGILATLKYTNLLINTVNFFGKYIITFKEIQNVRWLAPLAISFYMLQMIAYLLDCYWGMAKPFTSPFKLLLYCIYFPLMVTGPICRYSQIGESMFEEHRFDYAKTKDGLIMIAFGLMKKLVVSNRLAIIVNQMWVNEATSSGICFWISMVLFVLQLYADFAGCMDIISGVSMCFGIDIPENFNAPLLAKTTQEFWQRWHMSLGQWLRDYIMYPILKSPSMIKLGKQLKEKHGKKIAKKVPTYIAMLAVWSCMGLWHGNSWKYILGEGLWFWLVIMLSQELNPFLTRINEKLKIKTDSVIWKAYQIFRTIIIFAIGEIFFKADSMSDAFNRISNGLNIKLSLSILKDIRVAVRFDDVSSYYGLLAIVIGLVLMFIADYLKYKEINYIDKLKSSKKITRWIIYYLVALLLVTSLDITNQEILYAQF